MNRIIYLFAFPSVLIITLACVPQKEKTGDNQLPCNSDGTCNSPHLKCETNVGFSGGFHCFPKRDPSECIHESECFCKRCASSCGDAGMKTCTFSDTTTWGQKTPALCECNKP